MKEPKNSQLSQFYKRSIDERRQVVGEWLTDYDDRGLDQGLSLEQAGQMVENVISVYQLPLGIATNFRVNQQDYLIPMVIEEASVIAAASNAAKMFREGGGFIASSDEPIMIGQIQVLDIINIDEAIASLRHAEDYLLAKVNEQAGSIVRRGGGAKGIDLRTINSEIGVMLIVHLRMDVRDAMGANAVNTAVELIADDIAELTKGRVHLKILSNLSDERKARAEGVIPASILSRDNMPGSEVARAIVEAGVFAEADPYRATTHNKGIMNGIDALVIATGNDWRAIEAGAHAFAARSGSYTSLTRWRQRENGDLHGSIELPLAVGIVGGATRVHPIAQFSLKLLGVQTAQELAEIMAAVGLAQNFAAIRALASEGIQHGHMRMHARQLALAAGATPALVSLISDTLIREGNIRLERAQQLVNQIQQEKKE